MHPCVAGLAAGVVAAVVNRAGSGITGSSRRWTRSNHAGRPVSLWEGPSLVIGATLGALAGGSRAAAVATLGSGAAGAIDDHAGSGTVRGLRGHLHALCRGEVTTGVVKIVGLAATGLVATAVADRSVGRPVRPVPLLLGGALIAGSANLANLLDLRPGRCLKAGLLGAVMSGAGHPRPGASAASVGAALGVIGDDLAGRAMLGDTGANPVGALVGLSVVDRTGTGGRALGLAVVTALVLASEQVSFTRVIEATPVLRWLDGLGRSGPR